MSGETTPKADDPHIPTYVLALPEVTHRIRDGKAVCDGGRGAQCHWYPGDECDHEYWPCGHEYVAHDRCWVIDWLDALDLSDTAWDDAYERRDWDNDGAWPEGLIEWDWDGDAVTWTYAADAELTPGSPSSGHRESDVPLWDDDTALAEGAAS